MIMKFDNVEMMEEVVDFIEENTNSDVMFISESSCIKFYPDNVNAVTVKLGDIIIIKNGKTVVMTDEEFGKYKDKTAADLLKEKLIEDGFDGLKYRHCYCDLENFAPCGGIHFDCKPVNKKDCKTCETVLSCELDYCMEDTY